MEKPTQQATPSTLANLAALPTEGRNPASEQIDRLPTLEMLRVINREDQTVALAVERELGNIARAVDAIAARFERGGRLFYIGAGTSGRLGVLDASECPPTFSVPATLVQGLIAGGDAALRNSSEHSEDSPAEGAADLAPHDLGPNDTLVGIAASGRTPYVLGALELRAEPRRPDHRADLRAGLRDGAGGGDRHHPGDRPGDPDRIDAHEGRHRDQARPEHAFDRRHDPHRRGLRQPDGERAPDQREAGRSRAAHPDGRDRLRPTNRGGAARDAPAA